jgi:adenylate kinase family enzyme
MRKVAVFGNAGAGKSTLARRLAEVTGLSLYPLDLIQFRAGRYQPGEKDGGKISHAKYLKMHADLLDQDQWIIDGYGCVVSAFERFSAADTLVYIDLPVLTHYRWVTKRFLKGLFRNPDGWPENSPIWSSTLDGYRVVRRCHCYLTPKYRQLVAEASSSKRVHHLKSPREMEAFLQAVKQEVSQQFR